MTKETHKGGVRKQLFQPLVEPQISWVLKGFVEEVRKKTCSAVTFFTRPSLGRKKDISFSFTSQLGERGFKENISRTGYVFSGTWRAQETGVWHPLKDPPPEGEDLERAQVAGGSGYSCPTSEDTAQPTKY